MALCTLDNPELTAGKTAEHNREQFSGNLRSLSSVITARLLSVGRRKSIGKLVVVTGNSSRPIHGGAVSYTHLTLPTKRIV